MSRVILIAVMSSITLAGVAWAVEDQAAGDEVPPTGLAAFVEARVLETGGRYREAMRAYEQALREDPTVTEIRIHYATLLVELGLGDRAAEVLAAAGELDWYGQRAKGLALAQVARRDPAALAEAEAALRGSLAERSDDPSLELALAQVVHQQGRVAEAEELIAQLRLTRGGSPQLVAYHASLLEQLGRMEQAAELYAECAGGPPAGGIDCREGLVRVLVELERPGEAGEVMLRWLGDGDLDQLMRAASLLFDGGRYDLALRTVQRVLRLAPDSRPARTMEAYLHARIGRHQEAAATFRALLQKDRDNVELMLALAWSSANLGDLDEARRWLDRAWELVAEESGSPRAARVALTAARVELVGSHVSRAREWLDRVAAYDQSGGELVGLLVETYRRDQEWADGIAALLRLQPKLSGAARTAAMAFEAEFRLRLDDPRAWRLLRRLLESDDLAGALMALQVLQNLERWQDVEREAGAALERHPAVRDLRFVRAAALERLGRFTEAEDQFRELVAEDPNDAGAANYLGYSWADRGVNLEEALHLISRAVALAPDDPAYLDSLGWVHFRRGDLEQAEHWLRRAVGLAEGDGTILAHLGEVVLKRGDSEEGRRLLQAALDLGCEGEDHVRGLLAGSSNGE